jgi:hypothetical protein
MAINVKPCFSISQGMYRPASRGYTCPVSVGGWSQLWKVEKVVNDPRKPVMINKRHSYEMPELKAKMLREIPMQ